MNKESVLLTPTRTSPNAAPVGSCIIVIYGASGDLTKRKLIPALYSLARDGLLSEHFAIIGVASGDLTTELFRERLSADIASFSPLPADPAAWDRFVRKLYYLRGSFDDKKTFQTLLHAVTQASAEQQADLNLCHYLAVAPTYFTTIVRQLGEVGLCREGDGLWRRVIVEKPFGRDITSARILNGELAQVLPESQIYRIDHYLGKETVQNLLVFRFGNGIFEPIWNRQYIDHVSITAAETVGVEQRGGYYETSGALRDMVPNHLCQLLSLTSMEPPASFGADAVRDEQVKVLSALQPFTPEDVLTRAVRGQYGVGTAGSAAVPGYRQEPGVSSSSSIETYAALKLTIDNWRWAGVPWYLRTGKRLANRTTEIAIQFRQAPFTLFRRSGGDSPVANRLLIRIQPDEGITLSVGAKVPGQTMRQAEVHLNFNYAEQFGANTSTGYERLLHDCMVGDQTLFQRTDMVEVGWELITPILDVWQALPARHFPNYPAGSWGPIEADQLLQRARHQWEPVPR
jgi:glucose-6-phosphate 1-dehydrogenase